MTAKVWATALVVLVAVPLSPDVRRQGRAGACPSSGLCRCFWRGRGAPVAHRSFGIFLGHRRPLDAPVEVLLIPGVVAAADAVRRVTPRESMPEAVQIITLAAPTTRNSSCLRRPSCIVAPDWRSSGRTSSPSLRSAPPSSLRPGAFPWGGRPRGVLTGPARAGVAWSLGASKHRRGTGNWRPTRAAPPQFGAGHLLYPRLAGNQRKSRVDSPAGCGTCLALPDGCAATT